MSRYTAAYSNFVKRLSEIVALQRLSFSFSPSGSNPGHDLKMNALCRGGIVLLSAHIEGYIEDLGEIILDRIVINKMQKNDLADSFFYFFSKDIIDEIKDTGNPDAISKKIKDLITRDVDIWANELVFFKQLPADRFLHGFSNPKTEEIRRLFSRFGYRDYVTDIRKLLKANFDFCKNMVDQVVQKRHQIAHGDFVASATPKDIEDMIGLVKLFCQSTDKVVGNWFSKQGCPIR
jgi:hypothetical protein